MVASGNGNNIQTKRDIEVTITEVTFNLDNSALKKSISIQFR